MTSAARNVLGMLERLEGPDVAVHQMRCIDVRNRNAGCTACADACTSGAISLEEGLLSVRPELCIGCGTCATVCPTCALEARHPTDEDLLASCLAAMEASGDRRLLVLCSKNADGAFGRYDEAVCAVVGCLGRLDESLLAGLAARGCESVELVVRGCEGCAHVSGLRTAEAVCASASELFEAWGNPISIALADDIPAWARSTAPLGMVSEHPAVAPDAQGFSAGDLCAYDAEAVSEAPEAAPFGAPSPEDPAAPAGEKTPERSLPQKVGRDGTLAHHKPTRRGVLLQALGELREPAPVTVSTRLWGTLSIDTEACGSCRLCAVFCPTGALRKFDDRATATFGIDHAVADCVHCGCCEAICPKGAIHLANEVFAPDLVDGHMERFEMRPQEIVPGKATTVVNKMRKLLVGSKAVNFA